MIPCFDMKHYLRNEATYSWRVIFFITSSSASYVLNCCSHKVSNSSGDKSNHWSAVTQNCQEWCKVKLGKIGQHDKITNHFVHIEILKIYVFFIHSREKEGRGQGLKSTGKLMVVLGPQYLRAAKSYALAALSSLSYPPAGQAKQSISCMDWIKTPHIQYASLLY